MVKVGSILVTLEEERDSVTVYAVSKAPSVDTIVGQEEYGTKLSIEHWYSSDYGKEIAEYDKSSRTLKFSNVAEPDVMATVITLIGMNYDLEKVNILDGLHYRIRSEDLLHIRDITKVFKAKLFPSPDIVEKDDKTIVYIDTFKGRVFLPEDIREELGVKSSYIDTVEFTRLLEGDKEDPGEDEIF